MKRLNNGYENALSNSYKARREEYFSHIENPEAVIPHSKGFVKEVLEGTNEDYCLSYDDVASILGYSKEHVLNNIKGNLKVIKIKAQDEKTQEKLRKRMMSARIKYVISKKSLEEFVSKDMSFVGRRTVIPVEKKGDFVKELKTILGKGAKIQKLLDDAGEYLYEALDAKRQLTEFNRRSTKVREMLDSRDRKMLLSCGALTREEIDAYYSDEVAQETIMLTRDFTDVLTFDMYSIKSLKTKLGVKYTKQVYRYLEGASYVAVKLGDSSYDTTSRKIADRNIRYIIANTGLKTNKEQYRLSVDYFAYSGALDRAKGDRVEAEKVICDTILAFAQENKEKYKKKKKEDKEDKEKNKKTCKMSI